VRRRLADPRQLRRFGSSLILLGAVVAGIGAGWRSGDGPNASYLLDTAGLLLAVAGAVADTRVGALVMSFAPREERRRALIRLTIGLVAFLPGCLALSVLGSGQALARGLGSAALTGGAGLALGGLLTIAWHYGGDYAADRIDRLSDDDW
jgi:hypothetical protein